MTPLTILQQHQSLCNELYQLALEENSFLQQHRRAPEQSLQDRKRALLGRLEESLEALRTVPRQGEEGAPFRDLLEKTRARILQVLQLDRENEQLLLRFSLAGTAGAVPSPAAPSASILRKIYERHSAS